MASPRSNPCPLPHRSFATEPVHLQLADLCREAILKGGFSAGDRFPSERELAERHDVSRATANKVISILIAEGLLELQKGIGTRVRKGRTLFASLGGMESFTGHAREQGLIPATRVEVFERILSRTVPPEVQRGLGLPNEVESLVYLERIRLANDVPMILEQRWVREELAPGLERNNVEESFYRVLEEKFSLPMTGENHSISAVLVQKDEARQFQTRMPFPALLVEGTGYVRGEEPLWYQRLLYRGDRYQLHNRTRGPATSGIELRLQEDRRSA
ncbi:MAG: GntR family transcriptional regulator [Verrucomicrobiales bacterium]|nr:GntR family transcriptional regulator [Verrucomicrobiales bacterium]